MKYRADIDGLRALAVLPVLLYHAGVPGFPGGFVGVDIFFVISGYLICGMIDGDLRARSFSLADFYKRRILRILPALFVMFLVTSVLAYCYSLPVELEDYAKSLASAIGSVSNMYFAGSAGYFDAPAETKPLLHTWSLGVEEQFYLVAPLLMWVLYRFVPNRAKAVLAACAILSFAAAVAMSFRNATFVFYWTPLRAWELALGALLSIGLFPLPRNAMRRDLLGWSGVVLIAAVVLFGSPSMPLLLMTSPAAIGAALVIASSHTEASVVGRLLSRRSMVFIGLISYSLYLWHWPLIVFQRTDGILFASPPGMTAKAAVIAASFVLAVLSWRFVELPFRAKAKTTSRSRTFGAAALATASGVALCGLVLMVSGAPFRFPQRVVKIASYLGYDPTHAFRSGQCYLETNRQQLDIANCMAMDTRRPNYLLVGDSHAAHLWLGLSVAMPDVHLMQASASSCRPALQAEGLIDTRVCPRLMRFVFDEFLKVHYVDKVLLAASWKDEDMAALAGTIDTLVRRGLNVTVLGPIVEYEAALPRLLVDEILQGDPNVVQAGRTEGIHERDFAMRKMVTARGATYLSVYDVVCRDGHCQEFATADVPMQFDEGHLTAEGSLEVGRRLAASFGKKVARADDVRD
jgi:peptidoglycan/LPS O-acetylase OafA/YrhL